MSTLSHQTSRSDMNERAQDSDRRQQPDRRRGGRRRETDQQNAEESFQLDRIKNEQSQEHSGKKSSNRETPVKSRPFTQTLSEDEVRFLLDDD